MNTKFKKIICMSCSLVLGMSLLMGCTKSEETNKADDQKATVEEKKKDSPANEGTADAEENKFAGKVLEFYMFQGGYGTAFEEEMIKRFEEKYDVTVNLTASPKLEEILRPKLIAGRAPDLVMYNWGQHGIVESMFKEEGFYDLTSIFEDKALDQDVKLRDTFLPGFLESSLCSPYEDGKIYLAPSFYSGMGMIYNRTYFAEKGIEPPKTWDDFFALGDFAKAEGRALYTYQGIYPSYNEMLINPAIASAVGLDQFNAYTHYEEGSFKNDTVKQVLSNLQDVANKGYLMDGTVALNHTQAQTDMMMGKSLFVPCGTWIEGEMKDAPREDGFEFAMAAAPTLSDTDDTYAQAFMNMLWVPRAGNNPELAAEFIRNLYTKEAQLIGAEKAKGLFPIKGSLDHCRPVMAESLQGMYEMFANAKPLFVNFKPLPAGSKVNIAQELYENNLTHVMTGEKTVDEWMENVEKAFAEAREDLSNVE